MCPPGKAQPKATRATKVETSRGPAPGAEQWLLRTGTESQRGPASCFHNYSFVPPDFSLQYVIPFHLVNTDGVLLPVQSHRNMEQSLVTAGSLHCSLESSNLLFSCWIFHPCSG